MSELQKLIKEYEETVSNLTEREEIWKVKDIETAVKLNVRKRVYETVICDLRSLL